ncbi:MAG: extracellular solute-binding protein [Oscillospiraceae bacterium]|nr:extracellular solute-binding protein [Oscillospiraceae bacterium]
MNKLRKKHIITILLSVVLFISTFMLTACRDKGGRSSVNGGMGNTDNSIIETYRYIPEFIDLENIKEIIHKAIVHNDLIYYCYVAETAEEIMQRKIVIESMKPDGTQVSQVEVYLPFHNIAISALSVTEENNYAIIFTGVEMTDTGAVTSVIYAEYAYNGIGLNQHDLTSILPEFNESFPVGNALITETGEILLMMSGAGKIDVYIIDNQFSLHGQMEVNHGYSLSKMKDGRVFISDTAREIDSSRTVLREVDFAAGDWGEAYEIDVTDIRDMYTAGAADPFDLYIDDGSGLFGYTFDTGDKTMILNWVETNIEINLYAFLFTFNEEQLVLLINNRDNANNTWLAEKVILTRTERTGLNEVEIITIVVDSLHGNAIMRNHIHRFNRENQNYQIEVIEFQKLYDIWDENNTMTMQRFMIDLMTGNAPDIMYGLGAHFDVMIERGLLIDLYPFIDADPELDRSDFFPNILNALESSDGSLYEIPYTFYVNTMIGMPDMVGDIESWTFDEMLSLINETNNSDVPFILFEFMTAEWFLDWAFGYTGHKFINWAENKAYLDSDEFISLLEVANRLPKVPPPWDEEYLSPITRMLRGEQLFDIINIFAVDYYQLYTELLGDDIVALGFPTPDGGAHVIEASGFSISASSKNQDAAWSFIRSFLKPDIDLNELSLTGFPLRTDLFDKAIEKRKTPLYGPDEDGIEEEKPHVGRGTGDVFAWLYALSDAEESGLREIIENASILSHQNEAIENMMKEELPAFLAGNRSASDTARILQNRVQTYLSERD